jgi:hypothetical protein
VRLPLVPLAFGRAKRIFDCGGFRSGNWTVYLVLWLNNQDPAIYAEERSDRFDAESIASIRWLYSKALAAYRASLSRTHYSTFVSLTFQQFWSATTTGIRRCRT